MMSNNFKMTIWYHILLFIIFFNQFCSPKKVKKETIYGCVEGETLVDKPNVAEFLGIPFAKPPVKKLRFMPPKPLNKKYYGKNCFAATVPAKACFSGRHNTGFIGKDEWQAQKKDMSEDCLQLNMWVPYNTTGAVLVYIFGGSYQIGSPSLPHYNGSVLADLTGSIVVAINYRLGVFGFGRMKRCKIVTGNMGLLDQQMALKWIYDNIGFFGGKRHMITLFGHGVGATSATAHMFSEASRKYFSRVIAISGIVFNEWALENKSRIEFNFQSLIKKLNCKNKNYLKEIRCMQRRNISEIIEHAKKIHNTKQRITSHPFMAVDNDGRFFKGPIKKLLVKGKFKKEVDILFTKTTHESTIFMHHYLGTHKYGCPFYPNLNVENKKNQCKMKKYQFKNSIKLLVKQLGLKKSHISKIFNYYKKLQKGSYRTKAIRMFSDFISDCDLVKFGGKVRSSISQKNDAYFYILGRRIPTTPWPKWMRVTHDYQMSYIFGDPFFNSKAYGKNIKKEQEFSLQIMRIFANFSYNAKLYHGWPDYSYNLWPQFNESKTLAVFIDHTLSKTEQYKTFNVYTKSCKFVDKIKSSVKKE